MDSILQLFFLSLHLGIETFEIYKCIKGSNNSNKSNPEDLAYYIQNVLEGYAKEWNKQFSLDYDKCLVIAKKITKVIESNGNDI
jgi:hypothetical protein